MLMEIIEENCIECFIKWEFIKIIFLGVIFFFQFKKEVINFTSRGIVSHSYNVHYLPSRWSFIGNEISKFLRIITCYMFTL